jgi:FKBP-type peptidyl-prolyl cis-trans isomerase (trigger factor)
MDDLYNDYHETAAKTVERGLVMRSIMDKEGIAATTEDVASEIDRILAGFGENSEQFRSLFAEPSMRESVENDLLTQRVTDRIIAIAKGEAPELSASTEAAVEASAPEASDEVSQDKGESG